MAAHVPASSFGALLRDKGCIDPVAVSSPATGSMQCGCQWRNGWLTISFCSGVSAW